MFWELDAAVTHLRENAIPLADVIAKKAKTGRCAERTRQAIEAGGLTLIRHESAKDYGVSLRVAGFHPILGQLGPYQAGDVVVIQPVEGHPHGHMAMFDGTNWVCDFVQRDIWPGKAYRLANPHPQFVVYRYAIVGDAAPRADAFSYV